MNTFNTAKTEKTTNVWLTPRYVLDLLGHFDTDPCAPTVHIAKPRIRESRRPMNHNPQLTLF